MTKHVFNNLTALERKEQKKRKTQEEVYFSITEMFWRSLRFSGMVKTKMEFAPITSNI
jgi:hypothetical protein